MSTRGSWLVFHQNKLGSTYTDPAAYTIPRIIYSSRVLCEGEIFFKTSVRFKNAVEKFITRILFAKEGIVSLFKQLFHHLILYKNLKKKLPVKNIFSGVRVNAVKVEYIRG
jgi:hypothetical protein